LDAPHKTVVTISTRGLVRVFRTSRPVLLRTFVTRGKSIPIAAAMDPSARFLVTEGHDRFARVYSLRSGRLVHKLSQNGFVRSVAYSPDGRLILTSGYE